MGGIIMPVPFNYLIILYFSTISGFWGGSADRRNHCSMDLGQNVISGECTLAHLVTHARKHMVFKWCHLAIFLTLDAQPKQVELEAIEYL